MTFEELTAKIDAEGYSWSIQHHLGDPDYYAIVEFGKAEYIGDGHAFGYAEVGNTPIEVLNAAFDKAKNIEWLIT